MNATAPSRPSGDVWTVARVLRWATDDLIRRGVNDSPRLDAELLLSHAIGLDRVRLIVAEDAPPIVGYDQDLWATRLHYTSDAPLETLEMELRVLRGRNLRRLPLATLGGVAISSEWQASYTRATLVDGSPVSFHSPTDAIKAGIGMVFQHFMLADNLTVLENVVLGAESRFGIGDAARQEIRRISEAFGFQLDPEEVLIADRVDRRDDVLAVDGDGVLARRLAGERKAVAAAHRAGDDGAHRGEVPRVQRVQVREKRVPALAALRRRGALRPGGRVRHHAHLLQHHRPRVQAKVAGRAPGAPSDLHDRREGEVPERAGLKGVRALPRGNHQQGDEDEPGEGDREPPQLPGGDPLPQEEGAEQHHPPLPVHPMSRLSLVF